MIQLLSVNALLRACPENMDALERKQTMLNKAIHDYLLWMISKGYAESTWQLYERVLRHFVHFVNTQAIDWNDVFTFDTLKAFQEHAGLTHITAAVRGLSRYLFEQGRIERPIKSQRPRLPAIYEDYLEHCAKVKQITTPYVLGIATVLCALNEYLKSVGIGLASLRIEHIDGFLAEYNTPYSPKTCRINRSCLRGFLTYLYRHRSVLKTDLAPLVVGAPMFAKEKPPRFLRQKEVQKLFDSLTIDSAKDLRSYAMVHLAYALGLRPKEISLITLNDISFAQGQVRLRDRKSLNPITLPLPEETIKAIAAYMVGARPKSTERTLFLKLHAPYGPVSKALVSEDISRCMHKAGLRASAYWLRHTYAQNLLEAGSSIFEIKQMLGHDRIQTSQRYIHIHTKLMREVLFDETL